MNWYVTLAFFVGIAYGGFCGWMIRGEHDEATEQENKRK